MNPSNYSSAHFHYRYESCNSNNNKTLNLWWTLVLYKILLLHIISERTLKLTHIFFRKVYNPYPLESLGVGKFFNTNVSTVPYGSSNNKKVASQYITFLNTIRVMILRQVAQNSHKLPKNHLLWASKHDIHYSSHS